MDYFRSKTYHELIPLYSATSLSWERCWISTMHLRVTHWEVCGKDFRSTQGSFTFDTTCNTNTEHHFKSHSKPFKPFLPMGVTKHFTRVNQRKPHNIPTSYVLLSLLSRYQKRMIDELRHKRILKCSSLHR